MISAAKSGSWIQLPDPSIAPTVVWVVVGLGVLIVFVAGSRLVARFAGDWMRRRNARIELVTISKRVVMIVVIVIGLFVAFGFALENANVPLLGILLATVVAAFGVQDLLKDYVSGYYVLFERHFRVGDHISIGELAGTITEVRLRVTLLKSDTGDFIVVPNAELFNKSVTVHTTPQELEARTEPPA